MTTPTSKRICVGVTGSIAAYRSPDFVKELVARGYEVQVVLTRAGAQFVSPRTLETFSNRPVLTDDSFDSTHFGTDHISVARWAHLFVIYGATADFMARIAAGFADTFLTLQLVATQTPVLVAPAMNPAMWENASVQDNYRLLKKRGVHFVDPIAGIVACGESGVGHIADVKSIADAADRILRPDSRLQGKKILISAGPMRTSFDPVRYVQNRSSGRMGLELARSARAMGAEVTVLLGPVESAMVAAFQEFRLERYIGADDYARKLELLFAQCDVFFSAAAVLDFDIQSSSSKMERSQLSGGELKLQYKPVPDLVARAAASRRPGQKVIAFAAETGTDDQIIKRARQKMLKKGTDALIANPVRPGVGPEEESNEIWILRPDGEDRHFGPAPKTELAAPILTTLFQ